MKQIYLKDKEARVYSDSIYFLASVFYSYPIFLIVQIVGLLIYYFVGGLNKDSASQFFWFMGFFLIGGYVNSSVLGILAGTLVDEKKNIGAIIPVIILPMFIVSGFFQNVKIMAWPLKIFSFISPIRYTF